MNDISQNPNQGTWIIIRWVSVIAIMHFIAMLLVFRPLADSYEKLVAICGAK